jgi:hypothetical protein
MVSITVCPLLLYVEDIRNTYKILIGKSQEMLSLGRYRLRWETIFGIKFDLNEKQNVHSAESG